MKAREYALDFLKAEGCIFQPFFARNYEFSQDESLKLLDELITAFKKGENFLLGDIILKQEPTLVGLRRQLIDGKQRLVSLCLLLKALMDDLKLKVYEDLLFKPGSKDPKIELLKPDNLSFNKILSNKLDKIPNDNLYNNYKLFLKAIKNQELLSNREKKEFLEYLAHSPMLVIIALENENSFKIYERVNLKNSNTKIYALLKFSIFAKAFELGFDAQMLYFKTWNKAFEHSLTQLEFWSNEAKNELFFKSCFMALDLFKNEKADILSLYRQSLDTLDKADFIKLLNKLCLYAKIYFKLSLPTKQSMICYDDYENRLFLILNELNIDLMLPLILVLKQRLKNKKELKTCFYILEIYAILRQICRLKSHISVFGDLAANIAKSKENQIIPLLKAKLLNEDNIPKSKSLLKAMSELKPSQNKLAKLLLFFIELSRRQSLSGFQDNTKLSFDFTLEHLLPKDFSKHWGDSVKRFGVAALNKSVQSLGNMTLLKQGLNQNLQNKAWLVKLYGEGKSKGIKDFADLKISKELFEDKEWGRFWDPTTIKEREEELADEVLSLWDPKKI